MSPRSPHKGLTSSPPFSADSWAVRSAIADVVDNCPTVVDDKAKSVRIHELCETDVKYLARFWVATNDLKETQWAISEGVKNRFDEEGISLTIVENARSEQIGRLKRG
ncbi:MAG: mechanosensitive ion channel [Desulfobulbaceae bacterium]|nr:mechanosensitive ion channel [Desulfobulbaceae bacterium]